MEVSHTGKTIVCMPPLDQRLARLAPLLEGARRWLAAGGFSFEATPANVAAFERMLPGVTVPPAPGAGGGLTGQGATVVPGRGVKTDPAPAKPMQSAAARPAFAPKVPMLPNQQLGFSKLRGKRAFALQGVVGSGKTKLATDLVADHWSAGVIDALLVIAPDGVDEQWVYDALPEHAPMPLSCWLYEKGTKRAQRAFAALCATPADRLAVMAINIEAIYQRKAGKDVHLLDCIVEFCRAFNFRVAALIDESHRIKNDRAKSTLAAYKLRPLTAVRGILTGTPRPKEPTDLFSQYKYLDEAIVGYRYKTTFRARYCVMGGFENRQVVSEMNAEELAEKIAPYTHRVSEDELGLERPSREEYVFKMNDAQRTAFDQMRDEYLVEFAKGKVDAANGAVALMRLQQITCGFLQSTDGVLHHLPNPRMAALAAVLEQIDDKVIIWARFNQDIANIKKHLGERAVTYYGKDDDAARRDALARFKSRNDGIDYFIASPAAAGTGIDGLQKVCRYATYYSNSFNAVHRWQSEGRIQRLGMLRHATFVDLVCRGGVDRNLLRVLTKRKEENDLMIDDIRLILEGARA